MNVALLDQADSEGMIDLLDFDGKDLIIASVINLGMQELFKLDLAKKTIRKHYHVFAFKDEIKEWCHETALYPSQNAMTMGSAVQFYLPHQPWGVNDQLAIDRHRRASATGIVIIDKNCEVVGSFGMQKV